jgi:hypothetical protein
MSLDLSSVTDTLIGLVSSQWATAPLWAEIGGSTATPGPAFTPGFTGLAPDAVRQQSGAQLSMYLYHVESNKATESLFWQPQMTDPSVTGEPTRFLPLALDLFYLLFAFSPDSYIQEQEAMSIALRTYQANPIVRSLPGVAVPWELTLTMEHRSYDELSRLWQATTAPLRMSLVYRAAIVLIDPDTAPAAAPDTSSFAVEVAGPVALPLPAAGSAPVVFGTFRDGSYLGPAGQPVPFSQSPATVAAGQTVWLTGSGLDVPGVSDSVYLLPPDGGAEIDVTAWVQAGSSAAKLVLTLPAAAGAAPAGVPDPGVYQLSAGSGGPGLPGSTRTGAVPVSIAAFVDPSAGPLLSGTAPFTVTGTGFVPGATEVLVGTVALTQAASPAGPGQVTVDPSGTSFSFTPPAGTAGTVAAVRVLVNGIESDPALWVTL